MATPETPSLPVELNDEPLVGWRCWFVLPDELLLRPIYKRGLAWKPREAVEAVCPEHLHEVPANGCKCGVWSVCHPMLLEEIGWTASPPTGLDTLPGIMVIGEVSLWGKIVQHERGWRASRAYPRHLYVFTDDPLIAETLRERYGVPVEYGPEAERLRRFLPPKRAEEQAQALTVPEALLGVVDAGLCPAPLRGLVKQALDEMAAGGQFEQTAEQRMASLRAKLDTWTSRSARAFYRAWLSFAAADHRAVHGCDRSAARVMWARLVLWQRERAKPVAAHIETLQGWLDRERESLTRGTNADTGAPYKPITLYQKRNLIRSYEHQLAEAAEKVEGFTAVEIPTYRAWMAMIGGNIVSIASTGVVPAPSSVETLEAWHQAAMRRQERLAEQERAVRFAQHRLRRDREAFAAERSELDAVLAEGRTALTRERARLREDVVAGVRRDHAELLREVGELEARRRGALAMLSELPLPPRLSAAPRRRDPSVAAAGAALRSRLRAAGLTLATVAKKAGVTIPSVCNVLAGRTKSARVVAIAEALIENATAPRRHRKKA